MADPVAEAKAFLAQTDTTDPQHRTLARTSAPQNGDVHTSADGTMGVYDGQTWRRVEPDFASQSSSAGEGDTSTSAFGNEIGRSVGRAAGGLLHSPLDYLSNLIHGVTSPVETVKAIPGELAAAGHALAHPIDTAKAIEMADPYTTGNVVGQTALAIATPEMLKAARPLADPVGRGVSAVGRGLENVGTSGLAKQAGGFGAVEAAARLDPKGMMVAAAPKAMEWSGKGLQKIGDFIRGLSGKTPDVPLVDPYAPNVSGYRPGPVGEAAGEATAETPRSPVMRNEDYTSEPSVSEAPVASQPKTSADVVREFMDSIKGKDRTVNNTAWHPELVNDSSPLGPLKGGLQDLGSQTPHALPEGWVKSPEAELRDSIKGLDTGNLPEFTSEGASTGVPGEFPPGPAANMPTASGRPLPPSVQALEAPASQPLGTPRVIGPGRVLPHPLSEIPEAAPFWQSSGALTKFAKAHPELKGTVKGLALDQRIRLLSSLDKTAVERGVVGQGF